MLRPIKNRPAVVTDFKAPILNNTNAPTKRIIEETPARPADPDITNRIQDYIASLGVAPLALAQPAPVEPIQEEDNIYGVSNEEDNESNNSRDVTKVNLKGAKRKPILLDSEKPG